MAAFGGATVNDNVRCTALTADGCRVATVDANCQDVAPTFIQSGNPNLKPEKSNTFTLGAVWDITPKSSLTADFWQIKRKGLPVIEDPQTAVDAGQITRDPATNLSPNDPGAHPERRGHLPELVGERDQRHRPRGQEQVGMGTFGGLTTGLTWTHLITQRVTDADGTVHNYAGTHGDCNITNCIGSPRERVSFNGTWDFAPWRVGLNVNYRGKIKNSREAGQGCALTDINGADYPSGCKIKSFTTADLSGAWKFGKNSEVFGSVQNVFDAKPPIDFLTYGAIGYNPLDYSGAIGRFYRIGVKHQF